MLLFDSMFLCTVHLFVVCDHQIKFGRDGRLGFRLQDEAKLILQVLVLGCLSFYQCLHLQQFLQEILEHLFFSVTLQLEETRP